MKWLHGRFVNLLKTETAKKGFVAVLDQAVYSGTNFVTGVLLARHLPKEEFGAFVIFYSFPTFLIGLQSSLISGPMLVLGSSRSTDERAYFSSLLHSQILASLSIAFLLLIAYVGSLNYNFGLPRPLILVFLAIAFIMMSAQEFVRRLFLTKIRTLGLLLNDLVLSSIQIFLLLFLIEFGESAGVAMTAEAVLICLAFSFGAASLVGFWQLIDLISAQPSVYSWKVYLTENWQFGKWLLGTHVGSAAFSQVTIWIVAALGGSLAAANFEATRLVVAPAQILLFAAGNYLTPVASQRFATGGATMLKRLMDKLLPLWIGAFVVYLVVAGIASKSLLFFFYGEKYGGSNDIVLVWVLVFFALGLKQLPGTTLIAMRRPDLCMGITLCAGVVTVALTVWLTLLGGETLAVVARLIGELILFVAFLFYSLKLFRKLSRESEAT